MITLALYIVSFAVVAVAAVCIVGAALSALVAVTLWLSLLPGRLRSLGLALRGVQGHLSAFLYRLSRATTAPRNR